MRLEFTRELHVKIETFTVIRDSKVIRIRKARIVQSSDGNVTDVNELDAGANMQAWRVFRDIIGDAFRKLF